MKRSRIVILSVILLMMMAFGGCEENESPQIGYYMGIQYEFRDFDIEVDLDEDKEEFVYHCIDKNPTFGLTFETIFTYQTVTNLHNSPEFDYIDDDGNELVFDKNGHYVFNGDKDIHISYHHANDGIKTAIAERSFSVSFGFGDFKVLRGH